MDENNRNLLLVILLSGLVLIGWQYFVVAPQMKAQQAHQAHVTHQEQTPSVGAPGVPHAGAAGARLSRAQALAAGGERVAINTPTVDGSLLLKGARLDDLRLKRY